MAAVAPSRSPLALGRADSPGMNTIPDPRSPSPASVYSRDSSSPVSGEHHPDLSDEVATLTTKLINAINHSTDLDDALQDTRQELEAARERIAQLERAAQEHTALISRGLLVKKEDVERDRDSLRQEINEGNQKRLAAEKDRKRMESELENLTASLFEEANTMVANARKETESSNHRVSQLQTQLSDSQTLLASQQEQLQDLKAVMQQMSERDETETSGHMSSTPSTPGLVQNKMSRIMESAHFTPLSPEFGEDMQPHQPLFYSQLLTPVLRTDLPGYDDFRTLLRTSKTAQTSPSSSRVGSGNFTALGAMSLGLGAVAMPQTPPLTPQAAQTRSPRDSLSLSTSAQQPTLPPLKESKYFKRVLPEDIEPTLRLDLAPGLSWLARRSVLQAITSQSIHIEPLPAPASRNYGPIFACALCGENGKTEKYQRRHQFRIAQDAPGERAQRWPLCDWCLGRVRATCDFISFLKMCQAGVWRVDGNPEREKDAWEEGVRLREKMWWSKVGGGVVPSFALHRASNEDTRKSEDSGMAAKAGQEDDPFKSKEGEHAKQVGIGNSIAERHSEGRKTSTSAVAGAEAKRKDSAAAEDSISSDSVSIDEQVQQQLQREASACDLGRVERPAAHPELCGSPGDESQSNDAEAKGLAINVPGSFDVTA